MSQGQVYITGNTSITADDALLIRGNAVVRINAGKTEEEKLQTTPYTTKISGNVNFDYDGASSGTAVGADALINISHEGSYWKGNTYVTWGNLTEDTVKQEYKSLNGKEPAADEINADLIGSLNLMKAATLCVNISDGAYWQPTKIEISTDTTTSVKDDKGNVTIKHEGSYLAKASKVSLNKGSIILDEGVYAGADVIQVSGTENSIKFGTGSAENSGLIDGTTIKFADANAVLTTNLGIAYKGIQTTESGAVNYAEKSFDVEGDGSLHIADEFTYTATGFALLDKAYKNLILDNATLYIDPAETEVSIEVTTNGNAAKLLAGVASGKTLDVAGILSIVKDTEAGQIKKATVQNDGILNIHTDVSAEQIDVAPEGTLRVGDETNTGRLTAKVDLKGLMFIDPAWVTEAGEVQQASEANLTIEGNSYTGQVIVGRNSKASVGSDSVDALDSALTKAGQTFGEDNITAAAYVASTVTLSGSDAALIVKGDLATLEDAQAFLADNKGVYVGGNSALVINNGATIKSDSNLKFVVAEGGHLYLDNIVADETVTFAEGFDFNVADGTVAATNLLLSVATDTADGKLTVTAATNSDLINSTIASNTLNAYLAGGSGEGADRISKIFDATSGTDGAAAGKSFDKIALMGTASAAQAVAINAANMIADGLEQHGSVLASYAHDKTGADLWIDLNGSFSKAGRYQAATTTYGYKSDLAGATIGADYAFGNGAAVGGAFSFGTGSARGQGNGAGINNDIEYYGFNIYGAYSTPYVNLIGTVGYTLSKNEISQQGYKGKPDVNTFSVGIRAEKDFKVTDSFAITPHVGIRYLNVDMDNFTAGGFKYSAKKVNITEVPVGVAFNANLKAPCGADVKPFADFTIAPAMGSKKASNKFGLVGSAATDTIRSRVANSNFYQGKIGVNATQGNHSLSFSYGIGAGSDSRVDQALQAKYRYSF
jgi:hypothetical protein